MDSKTIDSDDSVPPGEWLLLSLVHLSIALVLLVCGGDPGWWQAWVYSALLFTAGVGGRAWAERQHPGLMAERRRARSTEPSDVKPWDRILGPLMALTLSFPLVAVAGLDHRFGWSPAFPTWLNLAGIALVTIGFAFAAWALAENRFFSTLTRIQTDRGHVVCDTGPYRVVRHPGYAGNLLATPGVILALGSVWTAIPVAIALIVAVIRTSLEDRTLHDELPGYAEYARRVRYRLLPGVY